MLAMKQSLWIFLLVMGPVCASDMMNMALNKPYRLQPEPNYQYCTDQDDHRQLTDGNKIQSNWTRVDTVGWVRPESTIEIVLDLEQTVSLNEVLVHTIGGGFAGVRLPYWIAVLVGSDGTSFGLWAVAGPDDVQGSASSPFTVAQKRPQVLMIDGPVVRARYVKVVVRASGRFFFTDEIEVFGSEPTLQDDRDVRAFHVPATPDDLIRIVERSLQLEREIAGVQQVLDLHGSRWTSREREALEGQLDALSQRSRLTTQAIDANNRTLDRIRSTCYHALYGRSLICLPAAATCQRTRHRMIVRDPCQPGALDLLAWCGERECAAVDIINASDRVMHLKLSVSPLVDRDTEKVRRQEVVTVRRAVFVQGVGIGAVADPLVLLDANGLSLGPGQLGQIWLDIHTQAIGPGHYNGAVAVLAETDGHDPILQNLTLSLTVSPMTMPETLSLYSCVWAYPSLSSITRDRLDRAAADLKDHHTRVAVIPPQAIMTVTGDWTSLDRLLDAYGNAFSFLFFLGLKQSGIHQRFGTWGTPDWDQRFVQWLDALAGHLQARGMTFDRFAIYPYDEVLDERFIHVAGLIKQHQPELLIFANRFASETDPWNACLDLVDIWCFLDRQCDQHAGMIRQAQEHGAQVWTYAANGPGKVNDPYGYYRLLPWRAFKRKQTGVGFWCYTDETYRYAPDWDDTLPSEGYYGVIYDGPLRSDLSGTEPIVTSRRWEAWREGLEDVQMLIELERAIDRNRSLRPDMARDALVVLDQQVTDVLDHPDDPARVDRARREVTRALEALKR